MKAVKYIIMNKDPKQVTPALSDEEVRIMLEKEHSKPGVILDEDGNELTDADFWDGDETDKI